MKHVLEVPHDEAAVVDAAARLQLRKPNAAALDKVARAVAASPGTSLEVVCSMATGVGKTYLAAGLLDYFVAAGVRNFLIVTPGSTVQRKTVGNFTAGHPKSVIDGMNNVPLVITADNFNTGAVASALDDPEQVKLFIFNIQALTPPRANAKKRTHGFTEWLGGDLYQHLAALTDLVILADEHHTYSQDADVFSATVRALEPVVLVGLTATPAPADLAKVVFDYPLARAIKDGYVKTPVLVGRTDGSTDRELQLRDGLALLAAKQETADTWAAANGRERVNAVMFVVAESIAEAEDIGELLRKPGLFDTSYADRVLIVHSEASEDALQRLASVEDPDSQVRVIVSVSMLKEGWDVKNIFVICSFRPSISDTLTEQTLGRGLRLPWEAYTRNEFLDTVEVLSHERYAEILARADVLLDGLVARRLAAPTAPPPAAPAPTPPVGGPLAPLPPNTPGVGPEVIDGGFTLTSDDDVAFVDAADEQPAPAVVSLEERQATARQAAETKPRVIRRTQSFTIPRVRREVTPRQPLYLSDIKDSEVRALGTQIAAYETASLSRMELTVVDDPGSETGMKLVPVEASAVAVLASIVELPLGDVQRALKQGLLAVPFVSSTKESDGRAASRLAKAFIDGAGGVDKVSPYVSQSIGLLRKFLSLAHRRLPEPFENHLDTPVELPIERIALRPQETNRYGPFRRDVSYAGWSPKAAYIEAWFHSEPERAFANLLDSQDSPVVAKWARLLNADLVIEWEGGRYNPDFAFTTTAGVNYLVEIKGEDRLEDKDVVAKRAAAADWARFVSDDGSCGHWRYLFVPQSELGAPLASLIARLTVE